MAPVPRMGARVLTTVFLVGLLVGPGFVSGSMSTAALEMETTANPLRKVITLLQNLRKEVEAEGKTHKEMYEKFMCYCTTNEDATTKNLEEEKAHLGKLESTIKKLTGSNAQLEAELKELAEELEEDTKGLEKATGVRKKEAQDYAAEANDMKVSIQALDKAIPALKRGMEGGASASSAAALLQPAKGALLRRLRTTQASQVSLLDVGEAEAEGEAGESDDLSASILTAFLEGKEAPAGGSGQILGVLEQMRDNLKQDLEKSTKDEEEAIKAYDELVSGKTAEIKAAKAEIEEKKSRVSSQEMLKSDAEEDLEDTKAAIQKDEDFLVGLKKTCDKKTKEYEAAEAGRQQETKAIQETIGILNDDDSLEVAKKTLPSSAAAASFVQLRMRTSQSSRNRMRAAAKVLRSRGHLGLALLAEHTSRRGGDDKFAKLETMINNMIADMKKDQEDDDKHKEWCQGEFNHAEAEKKDVQTELDGHNQAIAQLKNEIQTLLEEIKVINGEVDALNVALLIATAQRKKEKEQYTQEMSELNIASSLLKKAKDRLKEMYAPEKKGAAVLLSRSSRDTDTEQMLGLSFVQTRSAASDEAEIDAFLQEGTGDVAVQQQQRTAAEASASAYQPKTGQGMGIMSMLDDLRHDIEMEIQKNEINEKDAQEDFDAMSTESAASVKAKKKDIMAKEAVLSRNEEEIVGEKKLLDEVQEDMTAVDSKLQALHATCDFLLNNYDTRKKARDSELEGLSKAISILRGADFSGGGGAASASFLQRGMTTQHRHKEGFLRA